MTFACCCVSLADIYIIRYYFPRQVNLLPLKRMKKLVEKDSSLCTRQTDGSMSSRYLIGTKNRLRLINRQRRQAAIQSTKNKEKVG